MQVCLSLPLPSPISLSLLSSSLCLCFHSLSSLFFPLPLALSSFCFSYFPLSSLSFFHTSSSFHLSYPLFPSLLSSLSPLSINLLPPPYCRTYSITLFHGFSLEVNTEFCLLYYRLQFIFQVSGPLLSEAQVKCIVDEIKHVITASTTRKKERADRTKAEDFDAEEGELLREENEQEEEIFEQVSYSHHHHYWYCYIQHYRVCTIIISI